MNRFIKILPVVFLLCSVTMLAAQSKDAEAVLVLNDSVSTEFIGEYYYYFKDYQYAFGIEDVSDPNFRDSFVRSTNPRSNFGNEQLAIWNKLTVTNETNKTWFLDIGVYTLDSVLV